MNSSDPCPVGKTYDSMRQYCKFEVTGLAFYKEVRFLIGWQINVAGSATQGTPLGSWVTFSEMLLQMLHGETTESQGMSLWDCIWHKESHLRPFLFMPWD